MQSLFRSFFTVSFYTILSRILGFIRDILIARFLGSTVTSDAFFVAFRIPNFFRSVLAEGAYSAALIPVFSGIVIDTKDDHEASDFVENTMSWLLFVTVCLTIIFFFGMPYIIQILAPGFSVNSESFDLAVYFGKIIFPYLIFISMAAHFTSIRFDLMGLLFGDILAVTVEDIFIIWFGGLIILGILFYIWKSIFAATVNYDLAAAEGMKPDVSNFIFTLLLAGVIAISIKMIGALLITGLLLIPAATARSLSSNPLQMVILSILVGIISVILGLFSSLELNTASGPSIIVAALVLFILSLISFKRSGALQR
jgi:ABC-type Mn2+/Zn2+ transport system permease subunit